MSFLNKVSDRERSQFANSLSVMLTSGIAVDLALTILAEQATSVYFKQAVTNVAQEVQNGSLLSVAFRKEEKAFNSIFVSLITAGEQSGTLRENLTFLAAWFERSADLRREVDGATLYPKLVFSAALLLGGGLSFFILPRLVPLFSQLDVELPLVTEILLASSVFIQSQWGWCLLGVSMAILFVKFLKRFVVVRRFLDTIKITIPFIGPILMEYQLALLTQLFATLLHSGLPITQAIEVVHDAVPNIRFKESIHAMRTNVQAGKALSQAMSDYKKLYPQMCVGIVSVGEQSGTLSESFTFLSDFYSKEVHAKAKKLPTIIEPILLVFIALIVGMVALAIVLPIYKLTGSIT